MSRFDVQKDNRIQLMITAENMLLIINERKRMMIMHRLDSNLAILFDANQSLKLVML